jgi:hypothetical protein
MHTWHHGPNIYKDTKPYMSAFLKKMTCKGTGTWPGAGVYLSEAPSIL